MSDYDDRRQREREESHRYQMDVMYEVWRSGGNTDRINYDRVEEQRWNGAEVDSAARRELQAQRPKPEEQIQEQEQEPFPEEDTNRP